MPQIDFNFACLVSAEEVRQQMSLSVSHFRRELVEVQTMNEHLNEVGRRVLGIDRHAFDKTKSVLSM